MIAAWHEQQRRRTRSTQWPGPGGDRTIHDRVKAYESLWSQRFDRLDVVPEELKKLEDEDNGSPEQQDE